MSTTFSPLRLHTPDSDCPFEGTLHSNLPAFSDLRNAFEQATGWTLGYFEDPTSRSRRIQAELPELPISGALEIVDMATDWPAKKPTASRQKCDRFVGSLNGVLSELDRCREENWRLRAELATLVPVVLPAYEQARFAEQMTGLLRDIANAFGFSGGLMYLVDPSSQRLDLHFHVGIEKETVDTSRETEHAYFEMQAMAGNVVRLDDCRQHSQTLLPAPCRRALCLNIPSEKGSMGVIWLVDDWQSRHELDLRSLNTYAANIGANLEKWSLLRELSQRQFASNQADADEGFPIGVIEELELDRVRLAKIATRQKRGFSGWRYEPGKGLTAAVVGIGSEISNKLTIARLEAAINSAIQCTTVLSNNLDKQCHLIHETVEQQLAGDHEISVGVCRLDLLTGEYQLVGHGELVTVIGAGHHLSELMFDVEAVDADLKPGSSESINLVTGHLNRGETIWLGVTDASKNSELVESIKRNIGASGTERAFHRLCGDLRGTVNSVDPVGGLESLAIRRV